MELSDQTSQSHPSLLAGTPGRQFVHSRMLEVARRGICPLGIPVVFLTIWHEIGQNIDDRMAEAASAEEANACADASNTQPVQSAEQVA